MSEAVLDGAGVEEETNTTDDVARSGTESVSTDEAFELLSNKRRRYTVHHLKWNGPRVELGDLSEHIAAWENGTSIQDISADERKRVYTSLQSHHLPKMDEQGIVTYDDRAGEVELTNHGDELDVYLEVVDGRDIPWSQYYLGLSAVNAALIVAVGADVWPMTLLPDLAWGAFVVTTLLVSALAHTVHDSSMRLGTDDKPPELRDS